MRKIAIFLIIGIASVIVVAYLRTPPAVPVVEHGARLVWTFEAPRPGFVVAAPVVFPDAIFLAVGHTRGFQKSGAVYAIDPTTGKAQWVYDRDGEMLATVSTPLLSGTRLFVGEGLHNNFSCNLHCLDKRTGAAQWTAPTGDHIEGGPASADGLVIFPAGNDGIFAVNAESGKPVWNFRADLHIDSTPFVTGGRIYAGSGASRRFPATQVVCLDTRTGKPIWRTPVKISAWGSPVVADGRVFVGLGNGKLTEAAEVPVGGLACFDAATGAELWTFPVADAVFGRPVIAAGRVVFGSRDGNLYGLTLEGKEAFRVPMGGPVMATPVSDGDRVYAVAVPGRIACISTSDGSERWRYELNQRGTEAKCYSAPALAGRRLLVAGEMIAGQASIISLHCFELPEGTES